jgi:hypothetical protein
VGIHLFIFQRMIRTQETLMDVDLMGSLTCSPFHTEMQWILLLLQLFSLAPVTPRLFLPIPTTTAIATFRPVEDRRPPGRLSKAGGMSLILPLEVFHLFLFPNRLNPHHLLHLCLTSLRNKPAILSKKKWRHICRTKIAINISMIF